jgi:hypothetical protein
MINSTVVNVTEVSHMAKFEIEVEGVKHVFSMYQSVIDFVQSLGFSFNCVDKFDEGRAKSFGEWCDNYKLDFYRV